MRLDETTTNVVTATGEPLVDRETKDIDTATVVVGTPRVLALASLVPTFIEAGVISPRFPNAGIGPEENVAPWNVTILVSIAVIISILFVFRKRRVI